ncbi:MAG TPA: adenylate/guanylate cyclase domain-containing response regulator [Cyanobacteria bacterium UBA11372]|nr:adenylate/guanylate cyclase domain-containing response regulator [Cyanobacteria bacterium UBA11372]
MSLTPCEPIHAKNGRTLTTSLDYLDFNQNSVDLIPGSLTDLNQTHKPVSCKIDIDTPELEIGCDRSSSNDSNSTNTELNHLTEETVTVLLVDDQQVIGEAVRRMLLLEQDIKFHFCSDPVQAISMAVEVRPTVILQDLVMPEIDGLLLLRFFRANSVTRDIPMIVLSSKEEAQLKARAFALGANDYLVKLPDKVELIARIRYHSKAYISRLQRNQAYKALEDSLEQLKIEQQKSERLLLNILPKPIAEKLKQEQSIIAESFSDVSVLFADIVGFTQLSASVSAIELVHLLNGIFSKFDDLAEKHGLEKIKTIGDSYMVVSGLPTPRADYAEAMAEMALDMKSALAQFRKEQKQNVSIRIGIHSGPVVAGIIGTKKFIYDLWGDTVNTASRMESHGITDCIQISEATYNLLSNKYLIEERGLIYLKGKGEMLTYLLQGRKN